MKAYQESLKDVKPINRKQLLDDSARRMKEYFSKKIDSLQVRMNLIIHKEKKNNNKDLYINMLANI